MLAKTAAYRKFNLFNTSLVMVSASNEGKVTSAFLPGCGFANDAQAWNATGCNDPSLYVGSFAQGNLFSRMLKNKVSADYDVNPAPNDAGQTYIKNVAMANDWDVFVC